MKQLVGAVAIVSTMVGIMLVMPEEVDATESDCDLVRMWEQEKQQGIDPYRRLGRPSTSPQQHKECLAKWELPKR